MGTTIWGLSPIFYGFLSNVPAIEIVAHRSFWSAFFLFLYLILVSRISLSIFFAGGKELFLLSASGILISINWYGFIYAVNSGNALQASLGYYIFPLVAVFLGYSFNQEKFTKIQFLSISLAFISVIIITVQSGEIPTLALILAFSFGFYGLIKGKVKLDAITSVAFETLIITPFAVLIVLLSDNEFFMVPSEGVSITQILLIFSGLITALPLVLFSSATKFFSYATVGLVQYLNPSIQFLIAVFYFKEPFQFWDFIAFLFIWIALAFYSFDSIRSEVSKVDTRESNSL